MYHIIGICCYYYYNHCYCYHCCCYYYYYNIWIQWIAFCIWIDLLCEMNKGNKLSRQPQERYISYCFNLLLQNSLARSWMNGLSYIIVIIGIAYIYYYIIYTLTSFTYIYYWSDDSFVYFSIVTDIYITILIIFFWHIMLLLFLQTRKEEKEETNRFPFNSIHSCPWFFLNSSLFAPVWAWYWYWYWYCCCCCCLLLFRYE